MLEEASPTLSSGVRSLEEEEAAFIREEAPNTSSMRFTDLNISQELLKGLYVEMKFERPTKLQSISLPMILTPPFQNLIAQAHHGSGKTTCFAMGILSRVDPNLAAPQALCICPTRDLAIQNMEILTKMGKFTRVTAELGITNPDKHHYVPISKRSPMTSQVIIGTAGRVNRLIAGKKLDTSLLKIFMFDDADHMLIEGASKEDSVRIMKDIHKKSPECKVLLYASIFNERVQAFEYKIANVLKVEQYTKLFVEKDGPALDLVKEYKVNVPDEASKRTFIIDKIVELGNKFAQTIIFVRTKESARMLHRAFLDAGDNATNFHGACTQEDKDIIFKEFKDGYTQHLITNDNHARGVDLAQANLVINYDLPTKTDTTNDDCELYLHRINRVGRQGNKGTVFNFLCGDVDNILMEKMEKYNSSNIFEVPFDISDEQFEDILDRR